LGLLIGPTNNNILFEVYTNEDALIPRVMLVYINVCSKWYLKEKYLGMHGLIYSRGFIQTKRTCSFNPCKKLSS
jgi:hypothetical protein